MSQLKVALKRALLLPGISAPFKLLVRDRAIIFMMHRFEDPELRLPGHNTNALRSLLAHMRKARLQLLSLDELFTKLQSGEPVGGAIAFTIDDGYRDQGTIGGPVFAEFDCPVTTFVTTGFIDGKLWFWWDRVEYIFLQTRKRHLSLKLGPNQLVLQWADDAGRLKCQNDFISACKEVSDSEKLLGIERLAASAEVDVPALVPDQYRPLSWDEIRFCEQRGMTFGPHTVTHPVLARADDSQAEVELRESWNRLSSQVSKPVPVFCYPNGRWQDFGDREMNTLRNLNLKGAVVGSMGYANPIKFKSTKNAPFEVQRFGIPDDALGLGQFTVGLERFKQLVRREVV